MPHHQHAHHHHAEALDLGKRQAGNVKTVESVVYVTAAKTFDGPIAGYSTHMPDSVSNRPTPSNPETSMIPQTLESHTPHSTSQPAPNTHTQTTLSSVVSSSSAVDSSSRSISSHSSSESKTHSKESSSTSASSSSDFSSSATQGLEASAPTASQASPTAQPSSGGMSGGAKAGLAIGLLLLIGLIVGLIFFFYRRKKAQDGRQRLDDEKTAMHQNQQPPPLVPRVSIRRPGRENAPRLSLRPLTDLWPDNATEKQAAAAAASNTVNGSLAPPAAAHMRAPENKSSSIQNTPAKETTNPFGDHAELDRDAVPKPLNVSRPSTPTGQGSPAMQGSAPGSPAMSLTGAAPGPGGPLNVHRVQLDFAPSMEDELELRAGQLVRMLHEYDDGWALCIRLDRSQQGVVPRSCISKLPVKPRPAGPPGSRGPQPGMRPVRPGHSSMNSSGSGPGSPRMRSMSNQPMGPNGPFGPGQYRSNGPQGPQRARASTASSGRRDSPPGGMPGSPAMSQGSMPSRKPVPGQAM